MASIVSLRKLLPKSINLEKFVAAGTPFTKKRRDADHLQNFIYDQQAGLEPETLTDELDQAGEYIPIPDYAYDCHTPQGRKMGKTKAEFFRSERNALSPFIPGLFDDLIDT